MPDLPESIRTDPRFEAINAAREIAASKARSAQARYRRTSRGFIISTALAAVFGGLLLYGLDTSASELPNSPRLKQFVGSPTNQIIIGVVQAACLAIAAFCGSILSRLRYDESWIENRTKAEKGRLDRAMMALELGHAQGPDFFRQAGQYFNTELIDGQLQYLAKAVLLHENRARTLAVFGATVAAIAALAVGFGGARLSSLVLFAAFIGVISPAFISALKSWEETSGDQERAKFHANTWDQLNAAKGKRLEFDTAITNNDLEAARAYANTVLEVLRTDHTAFEKLRKGMPVISSVRL